ncbi:MAG: fatty acyl-AMP ligase [Alphaproteobacteria bacterium]|nr:fatty acyl-AMP ligase [Alphaproteobacteria bacterium]
MGSEPTVVHALIAQAAATPDRPLFTFVDAKGTPVATRSVGEALGAAERIGSALLAAGLRPGEAVLMVYPPGLAFVDAFLGCLRAGLVPAPVPPPLASAVERGLPGFASVAADCRATAVLTEASFLASRAGTRVSEALAHTPGWTGIPWHATDALSGEAPLPDLPEPSDVAILQYTSGSTRAPRGVVIPYSALAHQLENNRIELHFDAECRSVTWVPHFHDFALISGILGATAGHGHLVLFSPVDFLRRPALWGEMITRYAATHTWAPDFGYALLTARTTPADRTSWDFSHLRVLMTAAEPIRARTVDAFREAFAGTGFPEEAFCPAYGLAEHSVAVAVFGRQRRRFSREALEHAGIMSPPEGGPTVELFGCGPAGPGVRLRIVDPATRTVVPDGSVGEIWVDSPSKARGYLGRPEETAEVFEARLDGEPGGFLRTGDLGAMVDGELFVTGRLKDVINLRGRNVAPQDVEATVGDLEAFRAGRVVAFGVERDGEEHLVVVAEITATDPDDAELTRCARLARAAVQQEVGVVVDRIALCPPGTVPKTTSGKVQRQLCRRRWLAGDLDRYATVPAHGVPERD